MDILQELKDYLKITWSDEDMSLQNIIERGKAYLNDLTGVDIDFSVNTQARSLLLDYCRYTYNNASEYFAENYRRELLRLQLKEAVKAYASTE